jgi:holo-[acyl-carrier protein] synthase
MIVGSGVDMIEIERIAEVIARYPDRFCQRVYLSGEILYCRSKRNAAESFAARFAAKEAAAKALGTGFRGGVFWRDLGVVNLPSGQPGMRLTGGALRRLEVLTPAGMLARLDVSLTDEPPLAQAVVIITAVPAAGAPGA